MWEQYKKTFVITQLFVGAACGTVWFTSGHWAAAVTMFAIMQVGGVMGAAYTARLQARAAKRSDRLPLHRDRR